MMNRFPILFFESEDNTMMDGSNSSMMIDSNIIAAIIVAIGAIIAAIIGVRRRSPSASEPAPLSGNTDCENFLISLLDEISGIVERGHLLPGEKSSILIKIDSYPERLRLDPRIETKLLELNEILRKMPGNLRFSDRILIRVKRQSFEELIDSGVIKILRQIRKLYFKIYGSSLRKEV